MTAPVFVDTNVLACTRDAGVTVRSPFTLAVDEPAATYAVAPAAARDIRAAADRSVGSGPDSTVKDSKDL
jgi:hypothetical protein